MQKEEAEPERTEKEEITISKVLKQLRTMMMKKTMK
jgi:hypothetical protein